MIRKSVSSLLLGALVASLLAGCHGGGSYSEPAGSWDNYKCTAVSGGRASTGWATSERGARDNALDKCRAHAARPDTCQVTECHGE